MVTARGGKDRLDRPVASQKRLCLPCKSSQTHLGRRSKTSITFRFIVAIFKITLFPQARMHSTTPCCSESITFITIVHAELHWFMKYSKMHQIMNIASFLPKTILILHKKASARMKMLNESSSHNMMNATLH